jgi:colicin import membrane protein
MAMTTVGSSSETSVTFSLAELAKLEEERVRAQDAEARKTRAAREQDQRRAEAERRAAEVARMEADEAARSARIRAETEERARVEARRQAEIEVARIEAAARTKRAEDDAARAHELALAKARTETRGDNVRRGLAAALAIAVAVGGASAFALVSKVDKLDRDVAALRDDATKATSAIDAARASALSAIDRRISATAARAAGAGASASADKALVDVRRAALEDKAGKALDDGAVRAMDDALTAWEARIVRAEKARALDRRRADLVAWATGAHRTEALAKVDALAAKALAEPEDRTLSALDDALSQAREALSSRAVPGGHGVIAIKDKNTTGRTCTDPNDPLCGFNGQPL